MYLDRAIAEDKEMVESWKGDAEGMLTFVGLQITTHTSAYNLDIVDWSFFGHRCGITRIIRPKYSAQPAGHLIILSRTYLSAIIYPIEWISASYPLKLDRSYRAIRSAYIWRLGQRALVLKSRHESDVWPVGDIVTAVGAALSKGRPPLLQPLQASTNSRILQARSRESPYSLDRRSVASATPYLPFSLLCWPFRVLVYYSSHYFQDSDRLDRCMRSFIRNPHVIADHSQGQPLLRTTFFLGLFLSHWHTISLLPSTSEVPIHGFLPPRTVSQPQS
jgi:hypothetical protein